MTINIKQNTKIVKTSLPSSHMVYNIPVKKFKCIFIGSFLTCLKKSSIFFSKKTKIHPRHVGKICGQNRLLLFIPCHRVIRSNGLLGGFSAKHGVNLKNKILKIEELNK